MIKPKFLSLLILSVIFLLSSCSENKNNTENKTVFRYNESSGIVSLDPAFAKDQACIWATNQIYNGLVQLDEKLNVRPCIAKKWEISADGLIYTFHLRNDVFFHDHELFKNGKGRKVTAQDFVFSFNRIIDPKIASPGAWIFNNVNNSLNNNKFNFKALGDTTLLICLSSPFPPFIGLLSMQYCSVVPKEIVEHYGKDFRKNPVGTGPFKMKLWKEGVKLVLTKNENYFETDGKQRLPYLDAIAITFVVDKQSAFLEFLKGNIDFMSGIDPNYKDELLTRKGILNKKYLAKFNLLTESYLNIEYLGFLVDSLSPLFSNSPTHLKAVRQAINYGFDRKKMIKYLRNNIGYPGIYGFIPVGMPSFDSTKMKGYEYNPAKARKLLNDAGFPNGEGLPEITLSTTSSYLDICEYIQQQLSEINIKIKVDVNPPATLREMVARSKIAFFRGSWIADYPDAENYLSLFYSKNFCPKGPNYTHFYNKTYDSLFEKAQYETTDSVRFEYYRQMNRIIMEEAPVIVLYYDQVLRFCQKNITGLTSNPMNLLTLKKVKKIKSDIKL
ncbi:MAG: ABC transporter substrate-binding protein [Bacteroidetes bacterium]|nr:ABC transporter substrate-binding protein [Bacteroidota bacterium]